MQCDVARVWEYRAEAAIFRRTLGQARMRAMLPHGARSQARALNMAHCGRSIQVSDNPLRVWSATRGEHRAVSNKESHSRKDDDLKKKKTCTTAIPVHRMGTRDTTSPAADVALPPGTVGNYACVPRAPSVDGCLRPLAAMKGISSAAVLLLTRILLRVTLLVDGYSGTSLLEPERGTITETPQERARRTRSCHTLDVCHGTQRSASVASAGHQRACETLSRTRINSGYRQSGAPSAILALCAAREKPCSDRYRA